MITFHIPTDVQMVMDMYQRGFLVIAVALLEPFDDVLDWAYNNSLIGDHTTRRKPILKQVSKAVNGKEF
jgi:hypothetical protein